MTMTALLSRHTFRTLAAAAFAALAVGLASCGKKDKTATDASAAIVPFSCDASFENIMQQEVDVFEFIYPDISIMPEYIDEHACIDSLLNFHSKVAVTSRLLTDEEVSYLKSHKRQVRQQRIAVDALALIVNPANNIDQISVKELTEILSGRETEWNNVWPNDGLGRIEVVFDHQGSSTVEYMRDSLLAGGKLGDNVFAQKKPEEVFKAVAANKNAIGVIGVSWISTDMATTNMSTEQRVAALKSDSVPSAPEQKFKQEVKVLKVSGPDQVNAYAPFQYYIYSGEYPLTRSIYMICTGAGGTSAHKFYTYVTSFQGQKLIQSTGVLPNIIYTQNVEVSR